MCNCGNLIIDPGGREGVNAGSPTFHQPQQVAGGVAGNFYKIRKNQRDHIPNRLQGTFNGPEYVAGQFVTLPNQRMGVPASVRGSIAQGQLYAGIQLIQDNVPGAP